MSLALRTSFFYTLLALFGGNRLSYILFRVNGVYLFEPFIVLLVFVYILFFPKAVRSFRHLILSRTSCLLIGIISFVYFWTFLVNLDALYVNVFKEYRCYLYMILSFISVYSISKSYPEAAYPALLAYSLSNIIFAELSVFVYPDVDVLAMVGGLRKLLPTESILLLQVLFVRKSYSPFYIVPPVIAILFFFQGLYRIQIIVAAACIVYPILFSNILPQMRSFLVTLKSRFSTFAGIVLLVSGCLIGLSYAYKYLIFLFEDTSNPLVSRFIVPSLERIFSYNSNSLSLNIDQSVDQSRSLVPVFDDIHCLILPNGFGVHAPGARSFGESCFSSFVRFSDDSIYLYLLNAFGIVLFLVIAFLLFKFVFNLFINRNYHSIFLIFVLALIGVGSADPFVVSAVAVSTGIYLAAAFNPALTLRHSP